MNMLKIGVLGAGHLGKIHIKILKDLKEFELTGFFDPDKEKSNQVENEFGIRSYQNIQELLDDVDAVDIVTTTLSHFDCARQALRSSKHIFIEKPLTKTVEEALKLVELAEESGVKTQVGHVERFNPAFLAAQKLDLQPIFIESHRLSQFNPRGTDVSVVYDLMIHDIDIIISLIKSNVRNISASGVDVISQNPDITSARIEFDNSCVANLTASRISLKNERKMRLFQKSAYITIDFLKKKVEIFKLRDASEAENYPYTMELNTGKDQSSKIISYETPEVEEVNAIQMELELFAQSILKDTPPAVPVEEGYQSMKLASQILKKIEAVKIH